MHCPHSEYNVAEGTKVERNLHPCVSSGQNFQEKHSTAKAKITIQENISSSGFTSGLSSGVSRISAQNVSS